MKTNLLKRTLAVLLAGAMVFGGIQIPAKTVNAATFSSTRSQSGYLKVQGVTAVADSISTQEGNALTDGVLTGVTDGNVSTYLYSAYGTDPNHVEGTPDAITGNNTITLTLPENEEIVGITYLPRQVQMSSNNGPIKTCQVYVSENGTDFGENPVATSAWEYTSTGSQMGEDITVEKELIFAAPAENVKAVKLVVTSGHSNTGDPFINAAEIGVLTAEGISPALSLAAPAENAEVPEAEAILDYVESIADAAENPATLTLSDDFAMQDIEGYNNVFNGTVTAARDGLNNDKLNKSSTDTVAITFKFKCDAYPGSDNRVVASKANEWGLEFGSETKLAVFGQNSSGGWPQDSVTIGDDFWGAWHEIAVCFTEGGFSLLVDDQVSTNDRASAEQILDLSKAGTFKINPGAVSGMTYADFKVYTGLGTTERVASKTALETALENATLLFSLEESSAPVDPGYTVESTVWTNEAGETVSTFTNGDTYTAAITLAAKTGKVFTSVPSTIRVGEDDVAVNAEITDGGSKMAITYVYDGLATTEEPVIDANLTVEARYMSNHIRWDAVEDAASYNVYRITEEGETTVAEGITATSYVDENEAITGTQYSYKVRAVYADGSTAVTEAVQDAYPAGIEAVQEHAQFHKDFVMSKDTGFDGTRVYTGTEEEVNSVKDLSEGMMVVSFKPADLSAKATLLDIKNSGTETAAGAAEAGNAAIFQETGSGQFSGTYYGRFVLGSNGLRGTMTNTGALTTTDWSTAAVRSKTYQTYNSSEYNAWFVHNGQGQGWNSANWDGFLTRVSNIDTLTIGASVNSEATAMPFNGNIAYVTITDEVLSDAELAAYTRAVSSYLEEYREFAGIQITSEPTKKEYAAGEELNLEGLVVKEVYKDAAGAEVVAEEPISADDLTVTGYDADKEGQQEITVTYKEQTATFNVTVTKSEEAELTSIEVTTPPTKTEYYVGDELDTAGMVVTAVYDDDSRVDVTAKASITGFDSTTAGTKTVTVSYGGKEAAFEVTVVEVPKTLAEIRVTKPAKDVYVTGEALDTSDMAVTAVYSNGDEADVTGDATVSGFDSNTAGTKTITVSYTEGDVTKTATFDVTVIGLIQFDDAVLRSNATANSEQLPAGYDNDGGAAWAFDDAAHWWHSRYQDTPAGHEVESGHPSADNPIWLQTGFDGVQYIKTITYLPRQDKTNGQGRIKDYQIAVANLEDPAAVPTDDDFTVVKTGTLPSQAEEQSIILDDLQAATHVRLIVTSLYDPVADSEEDDYVAAQRIKIFGTVVNDITLTPPAKNSYGADENELNLDGMKVEAVYSDGSKADVTGKVQITGFDPDPETTGDQTITVSYAGKSKTFVVNVEAAPVTMTGIEAAPSKAEYTLGEDLRLTVKAVYSNGTKETLTTGYTVSGYDKNTTGAQEVTVTYNGMTATFSVTVKEPAPAVDTSELEAEITKAEALKLEDYKDGAEKDAFVKALADAKKAKDQAESQEAVDAAKAALADAAAKLVSAEPEKPVESISFETDTDSIIIKEKKTLTVTVDPSDAKVEWSSSDDEVLTVDANGEIRALWPGEATITAKAGDKTAGIKVTVYGVEKIYNDVKTADWFYDATNWAYVNDVMGGYGNGSFGPNDSLARAQFAVIMYRVAGTPEVEFEDRFPDVRADDWFADAVIWANDNGVITGYTDSGMFGPADKITREQIAAILYRYAKAQGYDVTASDDLADFPDADKVNGFAQDAMKWAVGVGLIKGDNGRLNPQGNANRAEAATLIWRFCEAYEK